MSAKKKLLPAPPKKSAPAFKIIPLETPRRPSIEDVQKALDVLVAFQASDASVPIPDDPADLFFCYDIKMTCKGREIYRHRGTREVKDLMSEHGIAGAMEVLDMELLQLIRPLKSKATKWINDVLEAMQ